MGNTVHVDMAFYQDYTFIKPAFEVEASRKRPFRNVRPGSYTKQRIYTKRHVS